MSTQYRLFDRVPPTYRHTHPATHRLHIYNKLGQVEDRHILPTPCRVSFFLSFYDTHKHKHTHTHTLSLSLAFSLSPSVPPSLTTSLSLFNWFSLPPALSLSLFLSKTIRPCRRAPLSRSLSLSLSLSFPLSLSPSVCLSLPHPSFTLSLCLSHTQKTGRGPSWAGRRGEK